MYIRTDIHPGNSGWSDSSGGGRISIPDISPPPASSFYGSAQFNIRKFGVLQKAHMRWRNLSKGSKKRERRER
jgi:hypothetical protein